MGQKVNPHGLRVGVIKDWDSRWFTSKRDFGDTLVEDYKLRKQLKKQLYNAGVPKIEIERTFDSQTGKPRVRVTVHCSKPGMVIGKGGAEKEKLQAQLTKQYGKDIYLNIVEVRNPDVNAQLVAENIASQLERRIAFRRAMKLCNAHGRQGHQGSGGRPFGRRRYCPQRELSRGHDSPADAARRHRLWLCRGRYHLRQDWREGVDLQGRSSQGRQARGARTPFRAPRAPRAQNPQRRRQQIMLLPKRVKYRRVQRGRMKGKAMRGNTVSQGQYGIVALEPSWITSNQIEAARVAMTRYIKRGGKVWIKIFPDKPVTEKPAETRMGSGKGSPEYWVAVVKPGRVLFEIADVSEETAREALRLAAHKLPVKCKFVKREEVE